MFSVGAHFTALQLLFIFISQSKEHFAADFVYSTQEDFSFQMTERIFKEILIICNGSVVVSHARHIV